MESSNTPVLCDKDVSWLISKRSLLPQSTFVSVKGRITCMGEKMKVKNGDLFFIELGYSVFILVKDVHLDWHNDLLPLEKFVFYDLRLTTIEKGASKPQSILAACRISKVSQLLNDEDIDCSTLEDWLAVMHLKDKFFNHSNVDHRDNGCNALSFSGKVTSISEAGDGIYELDNNMRLLTWSNPSILGDACYPIGLDIEIYNAHEVENTLICCARTLIRSRADPVVGVDATTMREELKKRQGTFEDLKIIISNYRLNFREVECLLYLRNSLRHKKRKELTNLLDTLSKSFCHVETQDQNVSIVDMFLQHEQYCPFAKTSVSGSDCRIKTQMTVAQLKENNVSINDGNSEKERETSHQTWGCHSRTSNNGEMLLGSISIEGGHTVFVDQSGDIPVVLVDQWDPDSFNGTSSNPCSSKDNISEKNGSLPMHIFHRCSVLCQKDYEPTEKLCCPSLILKIVGKRFYVANFHLVTECFTGFRRGCKMVTYLIFSLQDCVVLEKVAPNYSPDIDPSHAHPAHTHNSSGYSNLHDFIMENDSYIGCYFYVSKKEHLLSTGWYDPSFILYGRMLDPSLFSTGQSLESFEDQKGAKCNDLIDNSIAFKKKLKLDSVAMKKINPKQGIQTGNFAGETNILALQESVFKSVPVSVHFDKGNVIFFPLVHHGHCYLLTFAKDKDGASSAFQPTFTNEKLGKAVNKSCAKIHLNAPEDLKINEAVCDNSVVETVKVHIDAEVKHSPVSVAQVSSGEHQASLVSFTAVIHHREIQCSYFASSKDRKKLPHLRDSRLDLCELDSYLSCYGNNFADTISLYFSSSSMVYVLGLIPGMVVDIGCVERKVSKNNTIYCKFVAVSSIHIKCYIPQQCQNRLEKTQFTREYIETIRNHRPGDHPNSKSATWLIQCHIRVIFSLKLELSCKKCSSLFFKGGCQSKGCGNTFFHIIVNSVVLVEDGTCQAIVKVRQPHLVRKLLTLNDEQWGDVVSLLQNTGPVYISKQPYDYSSSSPVGMFLTDLIASSVVVRPVAMLVRVFKDSPFCKTVDKMEEKDFKLKDYRHSKMSFKTLYLPYFDLDCVELEEGLCYS